MKNLSFSEKSAAADYDDVLIMTSGGIDCSNLI